MIVYEQPLNEKIRLFLRLENLFKRFDTYVDDESTEGSHTALVTLLELHDMTSRLDVKSAILKIIDYQSAAMRSYEHNSGVNSAELKKIITLLEEKTKELYSYHGQLGQHLKTHHFLNTVKQRMTVAGGVNGYDLPIFKYWLNQPFSSRNEQLHGWIRPYNQSRESVNIAMRLIRNSAESHRLVAEHGFYQSSLDGQRNTQLLRIELADGCYLYPEVSAGKQRYSIRFVGATDLNERAKQVQCAVEFNLVLCGI